MWELMLVYPILRLDKRLARRLQHSRRTLPLGEGAMSPLAVLQAER